MFAFSLNGFIPFQVQAKNKASNMTNLSIGQLFSESVVEKPAIYYMEREKAIKLVRQREWKLAKPLIESLTAQYPDDGDTWYILGITYFQLEDWEKSIEAFKRTIALGTILSKIPTASAPSNDIMIKVAEAYSRLGQESKALTWINRSLEARYDGRHQLYRNPNFKNLAESKAFQQVAGTFIPKGLSRVQSWRLDLDFLVSEIKRLHVNMHHIVSKESFENMVLDINEKIPVLSDQEIVFEFMKLVSSLGNGHNFIIPTFNEKGSFTQLPIQLYKFSDGLFIVNADSEYQDLIGSKVLAFDDTEVEEALFKTKLINARDNEMQQLWLGPHYLSLPEALKGLGIVNDAEKISLTIETSKGEKSVIRPKPREVKFNGFPKLPALTDSNAIHNLKIDKQYWFDYVPNQNALYVQYNYVNNNPEHSFEAFNKELREQFTDQNAQHLILDIRHNAGGDGSTYPPLLKTLVQFESYKPNGKIFVIFGRNTFSAAHNLLLDITRLTDAILVGEPSGSRPNALSEAGWFRLPFSGTVGIISSQFHQPSKAEDHRVWVAPQVPVSVSSSQYFKGVDPAIDAILKVIKMSENKAKINQ